MLSLITLQRSTNSGGIPPAILYLGARWKSTIGSTPWPPYPKGNSLGGPRRGSGRSGVKKIYIAPKRYINTLRGHNVYLYSVKVGGTHSYHWALRVDNSKMVGTDIANVY